MNVLTIEQNRPTYLCMFLFCSTCSYEQSDSHRVSGIGLMRSQPVQFDREKLKEAVWLLASYCPTQELGNVKLHKMLYFSDMLHFLDEGHPITGVEYQKQKFGPTARYLAAALRSLETDGVLRIIEEPYHGFFKKTYMILSPYKASRLDYKEQSLLKEVADFVRGKTAKEISELSHNAAWEAASLGDPIPYFTALRLVPDESTDEDLVWADETARQYASSRPV